MEHLCPKCNNTLAKCIVSGAESKFSAVKLPVKSYTENSSGLIPYVCSTCGYNEWYVEKPENFR